MENNLVIKKINNDQINQNLSTIFDLIKQLNEDLTYEQFEQYLQNMLKMNYFLITATLNNEIVAICGCWSGYRFYCGKYLEIDNFVVSEKYRGQKIGDKMIKFLINLAKKQNYQKMTLAAYLENKSAHKFYDKYGFEYWGYHRVLVFK